MSDGAVARPSYDELVRALLPRLTGGIRWGLERTERLLSGVGDPHRRFRVVHVGGTNGKGSVSATAAAILARAGHRTGLYTSPHLCSFRERIRIDGRAIGEPELLDSAARLWPAVLAEGPTFFEATTAIAFDALAHAGVEIAVVEVGLGGRLDATNVVAPDVAVITNVERDHVEYLGDTLSAIAREKAGIIKAGVPVLTGEPRDGIAEQLARRAAELGAPFHRLLAAEVRNAETSLDGTRFELDTGVWGPLRLHTPLPGLHQALNAALAVRAVELLPEPLRPVRADVLAGVASVRWPGRLQVERTPDGLWLFDAAHNPSGMAALTEALDVLEPPRPRVGVVAILRDKDWGEMLAGLGDRVDELVLTEAPTAPEGRRWDPAAAARVAAARGVGARVRVEPDLPAALRRARASAGAGGTVVVTGSFHTVGDALALLGWAPDGADAALPPSVGAV